ncbi:hypothetical protein [Demequina subtropica]|uniref:hypothetical protein n=1 Tax=Demequina subtropica TaxID=1638989 RepID=UPI000780A9F5|nr:hypothetical protein [Demequina subtropica]
MAAPDPSELLIPEGATLLHIGAPKTGSTALQSAASKLRPQLADAGVTYPLKGLNHQRGTSYLIGRTAEAWGGAHAKEEWWLDLKAAIGAHPDRRTLVSFEVICEADIDAVRKVRAEMDGDVHIVIVVRSFASLLPSMWQQWLKTGYAGSLDDFLHHALREQPVVRIGGSDAFHRTDGRGLVSRWTEVFGADQVTVIVLPPSGPSPLFGAFESLLGLPDGLLASAPVDGHDTNRGMTVPEAAFALQVNRYLEGEGAERLDLRQLLWMGSYDRVLARREPQQDEPRLALPEWALPACQDAGRLLIEDIVASGARVVGDLDGLVEGSRTMPNDALDAAPTVDTAIAVEALTGMFAAANGPKRKALAPAAGKPAKASTAARPAAVAPAAPSAPTVRQASGGTLVRELLRRARRRARALVGR